MTYLYYKSSYTTNTTKPNEKTIEQWKHLSDKKNWRITQLANVFTKQKYLNQIMKAGTQLQEEKQSKALKQQLTVASTTSLKN